MDTPVKGFWLLLFRAWLVAPLVYVTAWFFPYLFSPSPKTDLFVIAMSIFLPLAFLMVFFSREFREFDRVTPRRIATFFIGIALFVVALISMFGLVDQSFKWTDDLIRLPVLWALAITPAFTVRATFYLPRRSLIS